MARSARKPGSRSLTVYAPASIGNLSVGFDALGLALALGMLIDTFIVRLRRYFEPDPKHPVYIRSVRGVGYRFTPEPSSE